MYLWFLRHVSKVGAFYSSVYTLLESKDKNVFPFREFNKSTKINVTDFHLGYWVACPEFNKSTKINGIDFHLGYWVAWRCSTKGARRSLTWVLNDGGLWDARFRPFNNVLEKIWSLVTVVDVLATGNLLPSSGTWKRGSSRQKHMHWDSGSLDNKAYQLLQNIYYNTWNDKTRPNESCLIVWGCTKKGFFDMTTRKEVVIYNPI